MKQYSKPEVELVMFSSVEKIANDNPEPGVSLTPWSVY